MGSTGRNVDTHNADVIEACGASVYWWDGEYDGNCELPTGHDGPHFDGLSWYNDDNEEVPDPTGTR